MDSKGEITLVRSELACWCAQMEELQTGEIPMLEDKVRENSAQVEMLKSSLQQACDQWWHVFLCLYQLVMFTYSCRRRQRRLLLRLTLTKSASSSPRLDGWHSYELTSMSWTKRLAPRTVGWTTLGPLVVVPLSTGSCRRSRWKCMLLCQSCKCSRRSCDFHVTSERTLVGRWTTRDRRWLVVGRLCISWRTKSKS